MSPDGWVNRGTGRENSPHRDHTVSEQFELEQSWCPHLCPNHRVVSDPLWDTAQLGIMAWLRWLLCCPQDPHVHPCSHLPLACSLPGVLGVQVGPATRVRSSPQQPEGCPQSTFVLSVHGTHVLRLPVFVSPSHRSLVEPQLRAQAEPGLQLISDFHETSPSQGA